MKVSIQVHAAFYRAYLHGKNIAQEVWWVL